MLIPQSVKDRAIKIAIPILLEKFEPALLNIIAAKDKKSPYKNITKKLVQEAFPGLLPT